MSQLDFTTALARLLSDRELRDRFRADPSSVARELTGNDTARAQLLQLQPAQLEAQAATLLAKRRGQVAARLPLTCSQLAESAADLFAEYAANGPWPETHRRHSLDALGFAEWLQERSPGTVVRHELAVCAVAAKRRRFACCLVSHPAVPLRRRGWLLLLRTRRGVSSVRVWLPLPGL